MTGPVTNTTSLPNPLVDAAAAAAPAEATNETSSVGVPARSASAPAPEDAPRPNLRQLSDGAQSRLTRLLARGAGKTEGMTGSLLEAVRKDIPRPGVFKKGRALQPAILAAAEKCDRATAEFAKVPASAFRSPDPEEALAKLKAYTDAQNELYDALQKYQNETGGHNPAVTRYMNETQFRASEAINLAGRLMTEQKPIEPGRDPVPVPVANDTDMISGMAEVGGRMHGGQLFSVMREKAETYAAKLDALEGNSDNLKPEEFRAAAHALREDVSSLLSKVQDLKQSEAGLQFDEGLQKGLETVLAGADARLAVLEECDPQTAVTNALKDFFVPYDSGAIRTMADDLPRKAPEPVRTALQRLAVAVDQYNTSAAEMIGRSERGEIKNEADLNRAMAGPIECLHGRSSSGKRGCKVLHMLVNVRHFQDAGEFRSYLESALNEAIDPKEALALYRYAKSPEFKQSAAYKAAEVMDDTHALVDDRTLSGQINEIYMMKHAITQEKTGLRADLVAASMERNVCLATLVDASLRGIPAAHLETRADDAMLVSSKVLGQGVANTVTRLTYAGESGEPVTLVFKPEVPARQGLSHLCAHNLGYDQGTRVMELNVASSAAADAIGCGDVVARSTIGVHDGRVGLFMEMAPGKTANSLRSGEFPQIDLLLGQAAQYGTLDKVRGNLLRELTKLGWADALTGQVDRHGDNYLVNIDPKTGDVKVTGIDNDASWGERKLGMMRLNVGLDTERYKMVADATTIGRRGMANLRGQFGLNQLFRPPYIDQATFAKLMSINETDYKALLPESMSNAQTDAALERLRDAKSWAADLASRNRVLNDNAWSSPIRMTELQNDRNALLVGAGGDPVTVTLKSDFFTRDFLSSFRRDPH